MTKQKLLRMIELSVDYGMDGGIMDREDLQERRVQAMVAAYIPETEEVARDGENNQSKA